MWLAEADVYSVSISAPSSVSRRAIPAFRGQCGMSSLGGVGSEWAVLWEREREGEKREEEGIPVNSTGNTSTSQILVPRVPCTDAMPSSAISELVSKPRPKSTPRGYIFQGLGTEKR